MSIKFFGQFLIEQGEVDVGHVREALDFMHETNRTVGAIAIELGFMLPAETDLVNNAQLHTDKPFGDLAVEMGSMTPEQLVEVLLAKQATRLLLGEALAHLGHLQPDRLGRLLDAFKEDQAPYTKGEISLPDSLANNRVAPYVLQLLPRLVMRVAQIVAKVGDARVLGNTPVYAKHRVSVPVKGVRGLDVALVGDDDFCRRLAAGAAGMPLSELDPSMIADGVGEFLNVLCGQAVCGVERDGHSADLGPPDLRADLSDGFIFDLAVSEGNAALILSQF